MATDPSLLALPGPLLYRVLAGSHAYGLAGPGSDEDWRGIFGLPRDAFLGLRPGHELPSAVRVPPDGTYYEAAHFARLVLTGNPNVTEMLWIPETLVSDRTPFSGGGDVTHGSDGYRPAPHRRLTQTCV